MPFAGYSDFDSCVSANQDASDPDAYCAAIMHQVEGKSEDGFEFKELPDEAKSIWVSSFKESFGKNDESGSARIAWATVMRRYEKYPDGQWSPMKVFSGVDFKSILKEDRVIFGAASVSVIDSDNELITEDALKQAFKSYVTRGHVLFYHKNIPVGEVLPLYKGKDGIEYASGVKDGKLNVAVRLYKDTEIANEVWDAIEKGQLRSFSIGGKVIGDSVKVCPTSDTCYNRIDKIDLHEISIVPNPANEASYFNIIKSKVEVRKTLAEEKLAKIQELIEKNEVVNCPKFSKEAIKILKGENSMSDADTIKELTERIAKLEAARKAEHEGDCPEGHHMVEGECVPLSEKADVKPMVENQKSEPTKPETSSGAKVETNPSPAVPKTEIETMRAELADLREAFKLIPSATKEIAGLRDTLIRAPNPAVRLETPPETNVSVSFDPDRKPTEYVDWTDRASGSGTDGSFEQRMKRMESEMGGKDIKKEESNAETQKDSKAELASLRNDISGVAASVKKTMADFKEMKEKAEIGDLRSQVASLSGIIEEYRNEVSGLKDTLSKATVNPIEAGAAPSEKRTVATDKTGPLVDIVDWEGTSRSGSFEARMRKMEREYGITQ